jgi:hypothetical protein
MSHTRPITNPAAADPSQPHPETAVHRGSLRRVLAVCLLLFSGLGVEATHPLQCNLICTQSTRRRD